LLLCMGHRKGKKQGEEVSKPFHTKKVL